jgi:predicted ArsR family transcriptional regulator
MAAAGLSQETARSVPANRAGAAKLRRPADRLSRLRALETLSRLAQRLAADAAPVVDAELTGRLLSVTPRTARRQLRALVDEGLALPLPPARRQHPGRPRLAYRLVVEKLDRRAAQ